MDVDDGTCHAFPFSRMCSPCPIARGQSTFAPESLIAFAQRGCSASMIAANCSGVCGGNGSMPNLTQLLAEFGRRLDLLQLGGQPRDDVLRRARRRDDALPRLPVETRHRRPRSAAPPASACVGFAADVPSAVTLPAWMFGTATVASENMTWMLPVEQIGQRRRRALVRHVLDRRARTRVFSASMNRWCGLPLPTDA